MTRPLRILVSAGEASGDLAAAEVLRALRAAGVAHEAFGMGGAALAAEGLLAVEGMPERRSALAVVGLAEAARAVPVALSTVGALARAADARGADVALLVDLAETNGWLARRLRCPVVRYGAPQVWAWRPGRARALARSGAALAVLLPFEEPWWRAAGARRVRFVGHPAVARARAVAAAAGTAHRRGRGGPPCIALLPGSRPHEIARHWPVLVAAARLLAARLPAVRFVTTCAGPAPDAPPIARVAAGTDALIEADVAIAASGTVTLEAAALGVPCVVGYRMSPLTWRAAQALMQLPYVSLPNVLAGHALLPELLQDAFSPARGAAAAIVLLDAPGALRRGLADVAARALGPDADPAGSVARMVQAAAAAKPSLGDRG